MSFLRNTILSFTIATNFALFLAHPAKAHDIKTTKLDPPYYYNYHGMLLDRHHQPVTLTPEYIETAQKRLAEMILAEAKPEIRQEHADRTEEFLAVLQPDEFHAAYTRVGLIGILLEKVETSADHRYREYNLSLRSNIAKAFGLLVTQEEPIEKQLDPKMLERWQQFELIDFIWPRVNPDAVLRNYVNTCRSNDVPIPPDWKPANINTGNNRDASKWTRYGPLQTEFSAARNVAVLYGYEGRKSDGTKTGLCLALPRFNANSPNDQTGAGIGPSNRTIGLLGIICQSSITGKACFWDNRTRGQFQDTFTIPINGTMELQKSADGWTLDGGSGSCPECHRGENVFLIHPDDKAFKELAKTANTRSPKWYEPIAQQGPLWSNPNPADAVAPARDINAYLRSLPLSNAAVPLPGNVGITLVTERSCVDCHQFGQPIPGGFYCSTVLANAASRTMPPKDPANLFDQHAAWNEIRSFVDYAYETHINALREACGLAKAPRAPNLLSVFEQWRPRTFP